MQPPRRKVRWKSEAWTALISIIVGVLISALFGIGRGSHPMAGFVVTGAIVGFSIYVANTLIGFAAEPFLRTLGKRARLAVDIFLYTIGGVSGWILGFLVVGYFFRADFNIRRISGPLLTFIAITAVVSVGVGLLFRTFGILTERLRVREWAERELEIARSLQTRLLPPPVFDAEGVSVVARNLAAHTVAGDLYDVVTLDDGSIFVAVADVAGKGMGASLIMASVKSALPFVARSGVVASAIALNEKLCVELDRREFVALVCVRYDPRSGTAEIVNAGCPDVYVIRASGVEAISNGGVRLPLGIRRDVRWDPVTVTLAKGERLLLLTDGVPEAPVNGEPLGYDVLSTILARQAPAANGAWLDALLADVSTVADDGLEDDWTAVALERTA